MYNAWKGPYVVAKGCMLPAHTMIQTSLQGISSRVQDEAQKIL